MIEVRDLHKRHGSLTVLRGVRSLWRAAKWRPSWGLRVGASRPCSGASMGSSHSSKERCKSARWWFRPVFTSKSTESYFAQCGPRWVWSFNSFICFLTST